MRLLDRLAEQAHDLAPQAWQRLHQPLEPAHRHRAIAEWLERHDLAQMPPVGECFQTDGLARQMKSPATHLAVMARRFRLSLLSDTPPQIEARINYRLRSDLMMRVAVR